MKEETEFFIGWDGQSSPRSVRWSLGALGCLLVIAMGLLAVIATRQTNFEGRGHWDFTVRDFTGVLYSKPVPLVILDANPAGEKQERVCYLVLETKLGVSSEAVNGLHGHLVRIRGSLIQAEGQAADMIAVVSEKDIVSTGAAPGFEGLSGEVEAEVEWVGEIVDSKCYLGAMNPGVYKPHRACAIRCISGGIPPLFLVRDGSGKEEAFLMVNRDGVSDGTVWLDYVAVPVTVQGKVHRMGEWGVLEVHELR